MRGQILIIEDVAPGCSSINATVTNAFLSTECFRDAEAGLRAARKNPPRLFILGQDALPDHGDCFINQLRGDPRLRDIPIIVITPTRDQGQILAALQSGADCVLSQPVKDAALLAWIRNLTRRREDAGLISSAWGEQAVDMLDTVFGMSEAEVAFTPQPAMGAASNTDENRTDGAAACDLVLDPPPRQHAERRGITLVDPAIAPFPRPSARTDHPGIIGLVLAKPGLDEKWKMISSGLREGVRYISGEQALQMAHSPVGHIPEIFLIEADLGPTSASGLHVMSQLAALPAMRHNAFCLLTPEADLQGMLTALDLGADDVISPDLPAEEMILRLRSVLRRKRRADHLRSSVEGSLRMSVIDPLTSCYNRHYAMPRLSAISTQAVRDKTPFAVLVIDLDRFKTVNDQYGHAVGDTVLAEVAQRLTRNMRASDLLARIGGEEFLIVLPGTSPQETTIVAERLREVIGATPIRIDMERALTVTISIGVAMGPVDAPAAAQGSILVERADAALLRSKLAGRNIVTFSEAVG